MLNISSYRFACLTLVFLSSYSFAASYDKPEVIEKIMEGDLNNVPFNEIWVKRYLLTIAQNISQQCEGKPISQVDYKNLNLALSFQEKGMTEDSFSNNSLAYSIRGLEKLANELAPQAQGGNYQSQMAYTQQRANEKANIQMQLAQAGVHDSGEILASNKCSSKTLSNFSTNLTNFIMDVGAERMPTEELSRKLTPYTQYSDARHRFCLAMKLNNPDIRITRVQRIKLYKTLNNGDKEGFINAFREVRNHNAHNVPSIEDCYK